MHFCNHFASAVDQKQHLGKPSNSREQPMPSINKLDTDILNYIWKYKTATARMIYLKFFMHRADITAYKRIKKLINLRLIGSQTSLNGWQTVFGLRSKGFNAIRNSLPRLETSGYGSETIGHDILCAAFQQGDWIQKTPDNIAIVSEQQMRRFGRECLPEWLPSTIGHRPDGFTAISNGQTSSIHALEVEMSAKTPGQYEAIGYYYTRQKTIDRVHWIVHSRTLFNRLMSTFKRYPSINVEKHNFMEVDEYVKNEWNTRIFFGPEKDLTFKEAIGKYCEKSVKKTSNYRLLDMSKTPTKSETFKKFDINAFKL